MFETTVNRNSNNDTVMKKLTLLAVIGLSSVAFSAHAQFLGISIGRCGVSVGIGAPVVCAPAPVVYSPAPVVYAPPVAYAPAPVYYAPAPVVYAAPAPYYGYRPTVVVGGPYRGWYGGYYARGGHGYHGGYRHH
jgi:hypothetical protein